MWNVTCAILYSKFKSHEVTQSNFNISETVFIPTYKPLLGRHTIDRDFVIFENLPYHPHQDWSQSLCLACDICHILSHLSYLRTYHPHQDWSQSLCRLTNIPVGLNWIFWDISPQEQVRDWIGWEGIYWGGYLSAQIFFCTNIYLHNIHLNHICLQKYFSAKSFIWRKRYLSAK